MSEWATMGRATLAPPSPTRRKFWQNCPPGECALQGHSRHFEATAHVRFAPDSDRIADILERQKSASFGLVHRSKSALLDDLVSAPKYVDGEGKPQRSCGLEVDDEF